MEEALIDADSPPRSKTILLVENEILLRMTMADDLREAGFEVIEAVNAAEALGVLETSLPVDLVTTDITMPGEMDGLGLAARIRRHFPEMKILIVSANVTKDFRCEQADAWLAKPQAIFSLVERVRELLKGSSDDG